MANPQVRFGVQTGQQNVDWADLSRLWQQCDQWGYDSLWNFDHFYPILSDPDGPCLEGWTTLAAMAQVTKKARIGALVNGNGYRHPSLTAKTAATVDQISGGRLNLGIGAGWYEEEHKSLGFEFKSIGGRLRALEESLQIITGMLAGERVTLNGKHYQVDDAHCVPGPVQKKVPIMIGGEGRKVLLRLVARYADMWNTFGSPAHMKELIDVIRAHGDAVGRDTDEIEKSAMLMMCYTDDESVQNGVSELLGAAYGMPAEAAREMMFCGGKDACIERAHQYVEVGVTHIIFMTVAPYQHDMIQAFAEEVIPAFR
jgi:F420-dependent oxidoreductase-like protein